VPGARGASLLPYHAERKLAPSFECEGTLHHWQAGQPQARAKFTSAKRSCCVWQIRAVRACATWLRLGRRSSRGAAVGRADDGQGSQRHGIWDPRCSARSSPGRLQAPCAGCLAVQDGATQAAQLGNTVAARACAVQACLPQAGSPLCLQAKHRADGGASQTSQDHRARMLYAMAGGVRAAWASSARRN
jgi:hypothetical protein